MIRLIAAVSLIALTAPAFAEERGFPVGGFDRLAVSGSADVMVMTGRAPSVRASGSAADLDRLDIGVEGGQLKIGHKREGMWSWHDGGKVHVAVTVPVLRSVDAAGSGGVVVDRIKVKDFAASLAGSGSIRVAALDASAVSLSSAGSGTIEAAGSCGDGAAKIAGSGAIRIAALKCANVSASIAGSGAIDAFASRSATLSTMGSGDINLTGGGRCTVSSAGSGKAHCS